MTDPQLPILDLAPLEDAFGAIDDDALEALRRFITTTRPLLDRIAEALVKGELRVASEAAHSAKGAANVTGAARLGALCAAIEKAAREGDAGSAGKLAAKLPQCFAEVEAAISKLLS